MKEKTGTQLNQAHSSVDDFNTKKYVLPLLRDEKTRNRLIEEHRACPVGRAPHNGQEKVEHSKDLIRVLDKDYRIGVASGVRGQPVEILEESFSSEEACEHAIFMKRIVALLEKYAE